MKNVNMTLKGNMLTITVDLSQVQGPSASGKTDIIASTAGSAPVPGKPEISVGLNIFKKR